MILGHRVIREHADDNPQWKDLTTVEVRDADGWRAPVGEEWDVFTDDYRFVST